MTESGATTMEENLASLRERKRLLDDVWLLALFALFLAVGIPWYLRILEIDFAPIAWSLFGYGLFYVLTSFAADSLPSRRSLLLVIGALQAAGVLFMGFVWHLTGSLQNPMLLLVFALPVVAGSLVLVHWQSYATALLSVATVVTVALIDSPELRWYAAQMNSSARRIIGTLPEGVGMTSQPFPTLNTPPTYHFALLLLFAVLLFTAALMTESLTSFLRRLYGRLETATRALGVAEGISSEVLRASPSPAALVYSDTLNVAQASQCFMHHFFLKPESLLNNNLFTLIDFAHPEVIAALMTGNGGEVPLAVYRLDGETRVARVQVESIRYGGRRYAYVNIQDISDLQYLQASLNAVEDALIVISGRQHILYFNDAARELLGELQPGMEAAIPLRQANLPEGWWDLGMRSRQERRFELHGKRFVAQCVAARILGERDALTVLSMRPVESDP